MSRIMNVGLIINAAGNVTNWINNARNASERLQRSMAEVGLQRSALEQLRKAQAQMEQMNQRAANMRAIVERIRPKFERSNALIAQLQQRMRQAEAASRGLAEQSKRSNAALEAVKRTSAQLQANLRLAEEKISNAAQLTERLRTRMQAAQAASSAATADVAQLERKLTASSTYAQQLQQRLQQARKSGTATADEIAMLAQRLKRAQTHTSDLRDRLQQSQAASSAAAAEVQKLDSALQRAQQLSATLRTNADKARSKLAASAEQANVLRTRLQQVERHGHGSRVEVERLRENLQRAERVGEQLRNRFADATRQSEAMRREVERTEQALRRAAERAQQLRLNPNAPTDADRRLAAHERSEAYGLAGRALQDSGSQMRSQAYGGLVGTAVLGYGTARAASPYIGFEAAQRDIAITGNLNERDEGTVGALVRQSALENNQRHQDLMNGVQVMVANGMSPMDAKTYVPLLAKVATATNAEMKDMGNLIFTLENTMGIKGEAQMRQALNSIAVAGKAGGFEFRHMARYFPMLAAQMKSFGATGINAVRELSAMMQAARKTTGTSEEAAVNTSNWFSHMAAPHTIKMYRDAGIDYMQVMLKKMNDGRGISAPSASLEIAEEFLSKVTAGKTVEMKTKKGKIKQRMNFKDALAAADKGDITDSVKSVVERFGMGLIFNDMQVTNFLNGQRQNKALMEAILAEQRSEASKAVNDIDFVKRMNTTREQLKAVRIGLTDLFIGMGEAVMNARHRIPTNSDAWDQITQRRGDETRTNDEKSFGSVAQGYINSVSQFVEANQVMVRNVLLVGAGLAALSVAVMATKFIAGGAMSAVGGGMRLWGWLRGQKTGRDVQRVYVVNMGGDSGPDFPRRGGNRWTRLSRRARVFAQRGVRMLPNWLRAGASSLVTRGAAFLPRLGSMLGGVGGMLRVAAPFALHLARGLLMLMGPVGWAIGAVAALAYGAYKLYKNWDTVGPIVTSAWESVVSVVSRGYATVRGYVSRFWQAGSDVVTGFVGGIGTRLLAVKDMLSQMGSTALTSIKSVLGIQSPSRRLMEVGRNVAEGAAIGIHQRAGMVKQASTSLAGWLVAQPDEMRPGAKLAAWAGAPTTAGAHAQPISISVSYAPVITVHGGGEDVDKKIAAALREGHPELLRSLELKIKQIAADQQRRSLGAS